MMGSYPVQRQMLPAMALTTSSRVGEGLWSSRAFAATELGSHVADGIAQGGQQIDAAIDEHGDIAAIVTKLQGGLGHGLSLHLAGEQAAQMDPDYLAPIPGAGERIVDR